MLKAKAVVQVVRILSLWPALDREASEALCALLGQIEREERLRVAGIRHDSEKAALLSC
jgi:hypothetical protein